MFLGHPRSGHSLVGALLNAHPNAVISHELDALSYVQRGIGRNQLFDLILERDRWFVEKMGGQWTEYNYSVPGQWQGRFETLRVIGDKKGGASSKRLQRAPDILDRLRRIVGVPIRIVQVVRNPFDNIATMSTRSGRPVAAACDRYFQICAAIKGVCDQCDATEVVSLRHENIIADPRNTLRQLLQFLDLRSSDQYLDDCASILFAAESLSRRKVDWDEELREKVDNQIAKYPFLSDYSFDR